MNNQILILLAVILLSSCTSKNPLTGTWTDRKGQTFVFSSDKEGSWILDNENGKDTFHIHYSYQEKKPLSYLDISVQGGPLEGKTLYGILEWKENSFRFDCQPGVADSVRPKNFVPDETIEYFKAE